jgi:putative addiction module killer protein
VVELRGYVDENGNLPFARWFTELDSTAAARVTTALTRIEHGNFSNVKGVGTGVFECRIDFGPGYRIYFGKDGDRLVILVGGGSKRVNRRILRPRRSAGRITNCVRKRRRIDATDA